MGRARYGKVEEKRGVMGLHAEVPTPKTSDYDCLGGKGLQRGH